jgi:hypothetical protein
MEEQLFILCSFDDETTNNINTDTRYIDIEHCKNCFEIKKYNGDLENNDKENIYIITNVYKNSFGIFKVNDIIHLLYGYMITIENISHNISDKNDNDKNNIKSWKTIKNSVDIYPIILFEKDSIQFYSEEIETKIAELERIIKDYARTGNEYAGATQEMQLESAKLKQEIKHLMNEMQNKKLEYEIELIKVTKENCCFLVLLQI